MIGIGTKDQRVVESRRLGETFPFKLEQTKATAGAFTWLNSLIYALMHVGK